MIALPIMLVEPAKQAGIDVPNDLDNYDVEKYKRFHLLRCAQLGQPMPNPLSHFTNAKIIAQVPEDRIKDITFNDLIEMGFEICSSDIGE